MLNALTSKIMCSRREAKKMIACGSGETLETVPRYVGKE